ncbi:ATP-binding cassette domain-containing protein [Paenibacillaceae bacterium WGS1546]|uniref:ATP-binding cassette domain-containing protein n=1 Tax=Cohnella sp. WGS1546 TaxID=3366810 RepID=UPI00372D2672
MKRQLQSRESKSANPAPMPLALDGIRWRRWSGAGGDTEERENGLTLDAGKITLLMGPNGAGKTTLLEKIAGLRPPERLRVAFGAEEMWPRSRRGKPRLSGGALLHYGYAPQSPEDGLFARTVREELAYSARPYGIGADAVAADSVGWDAEWLDRDPYRLSGGERRRTALAAAFATPAPWLLLDEPTAGLDGAGHERIALELRRLRDEGRGILLVSHDADWALPLADRVLLLAMDGSATLLDPEALIRDPGLLAGAGMSVPDWLGAAHRLWKHGVPADALWKPEGAAAAWPAAARAAASEEKTAAPKLTARHRERPKPVKHRLAGFDPRSVWLAYVLVSAGLYLLKDWSGLLVGAGIVAVLLGAARVSLRRWRGLLLNYGIFSVGTSAIFAWGAGESAWIDGAAFLEALSMFGRTMLILLLGLAIPLVMSPLSLRSSLEQLVSRKGKTPAWAQRAILTVTLIMRFVPVLLELWERFTKIIRARGKSVSRRPAALLRRLRDVSIPFLLALFRLGDEVALALESRGVGGPVAPTRSRTMRWRGRDYGLAAGALALAIGLWGIAGR